MTTTLKPIMKCEIPHFDESFESTCFDHAFCKTCQYVITNEKVCKSLIFVFIKSTKSNL
jgi:hypothetical protein